MESRTNEKFNIGLEIGGTNIKAAVINADLDINKIVECISNSSIKIGEFKTSSNPEETISEVSNWIFKENNLQHENINKVGISMFGPLNLTLQSKDYGRVLNTPKSGWKNFHVIESFSKHLKIDKANIIIETDVNCAAYLEHKLGNHK